MLSFHEMSQEDKLTLGQIEMRYVKRVGHSWGSAARLSDPTLPGHFPFASLQCSYGFGLIGLILAAFARRLLDCGLLGPDVAFTEPGR